MTTRIERILADIVEKLKREYQPEKIILYGSYAYGNPTRHSDIDLFIVKETPLRWVDRFVQVKEIIYDSDRGIPVSPCVYTPKELKARLDSGDAFVEEILLKGKNLYERKAKQGKRTRRVV